MSGGRRALVSGGAGFIGSHLCAALVAEGWQVRVLDDLSSGREENLQACRREIELLRGDLLDPELLERATRDVEVVFHQAAVPSVPRSIAEPERTHAVNLSGTVALLASSRRAGVRRLVFAASSSAYGDTPELPKREDMPPRPRSPYALQKWAAERYCQLYTELYGFETVALRYFNVYGPRQDPASEYAAVIPRFLTACLEGKPPTVYGDGEQTRDFTFVSDVVQANLLAADAPEAPGKVLNVAGGRRISLNLLLEEIGALCDVQLEPVYAEARPGDVRDSLACLERARALLGFEPQVDLHEGLGRTLSYFRERGRGRSA